jgi:hypothetical protein
MKIAVPNPATHGQPATAPPRRNNSPATRPSIIIATSHSTHYRDYSTWAFPEAFLLPAKLAGLLPDALSVKNTGDIKEDS